ncbi:MAG: MarR family winged helix-turn-helix transcriptional regulator [Bacteroidota bacterium]
MSNSFDPKVQELDLTSKIVVGLERLSEVFRVLLWEKSKETGLSPIQIQLLLFIKTHDQSMANVSHLSKEFNLKKPTVSDAIKVLFSKGLIEKETGQDARAYTIILTAEGNKIVNQLEGFDDPLKKEIGQLSKSDQKSFCESLMKMIFSLNQSGIIEVQRTCFGCQFYEVRKNGHFCQYIKKPLKEEEIRLDCQDFQALAS